MQKLRAVLQWIVAAALLAGPMTSSADTDAGIITTTGAVNGVAVDPATNRIFATQAGALLVVDGWSHAITSLPVAGGGAIAFNPITRKAYVTDAANDRVAVVDTITLSHSFVPAGDNPAGVAVNAFTNKVYVTNSLGGTVTVIDDTTNATSTITVGTTPAGIAVNPSTNKIYVANTGSGTLSVIDGATNAVTPVAVGAGPAVVAVNPVLNKIYVTHTEDSGISTRVTVVDGSTHAVTTVTTPLNSNALAVDPVTHKVYVGARGNNGLEGIVTVIDGLTHATTMIASGEQCCRVAVIETTNRAYAASSGSSCSICPPSFTGPLQVIDGATSTVAQTFAFGGNALAVNPVTNRIYATFFFLGSAGFTSAGIRVLDGASHASTTLAPGTSPFAIAANPATGRFYVVNNAGNNVIVLDGGTNSVVGTVPVGIDPQPVGVNPETNRIYVGSRSAGTVTVIDGGTHATTTVTVGTNPWAMAVNAVTNRIYVANAGSNNVTVIDGATNATSTVAVGASPTDVAVDPVLNRIYVANNAASSVTIIDGATHATTTVPVGASPGLKVVVDPVRSRAYVTANGGKSVTIIQAPANTTSTIVFDSVPGRPGVNPVTGIAYVPYGGGKMAVIRDGSVTATLDIGLNGTDTAINPAANRIYVGSTGTAVAVIDGITNTVSNITAGDFAYLLALDVATGKLAVGNLDDSTVTLFTESNRQAVAPTTTIAPLAGNRTADFTPTFTFTTSAGLNGAPAQAVFYQVDTQQGSWLKADGAGPFAGTVPQLTPGIHVLYAFAVDANVARPNSAVTGRMSAYVFTVSADCLASSCADVSVTHASAPAQGFTGKDMMFVLTATNSGPQGATSVTLTDTLPAGSMFVWASPGCTHASGSVTCSIGTLASGAIAQRKVVVRPAAAGTAMNTASVSAAELDPDSANNQSTVSVAVSASPTASQVLRYRLYSDVTKEHHFTTDFNEYTVLGGNGNWVQEGTVGRVLNNPGSFNGVAAVPYYRMYNTTNQWHHWTTDPNEYYTLIEFSNWNAEGVDGYILPTQAPGSIPLYRLLYPFIPGLHHWTIDANEYNTLIASYGWIGEGGSGFVIP